VNFRPHDFAGISSQGLQLWPSGEISGTPTVGSLDPFPLVVTATDAHGRQGTGSYLLLIAPPPPPPLTVTINGTSFSTVVGKPISIPATASGGVAPLTLSGTEYTFGSPGKYTATVTVTDASGHTAYDSVEVVVSPLEINVGGDEAIVRQGDFAVVTFTANDDSSDTQVVDTASPGEKFHSWTHPLGVTAYATVYVTPNYAAMPTLNLGSGVGGMLPDPPNPATTSAPAAPGAYWEYRGISKSSGKVSGSWHDLYMAWSKSGGKSSMSVVQNGGGSFEVSGTKWKTNDPERQQTADDDPLPSLEDLAWSPGFGGASKSKPLNGSLHRLSGVPGINRNPPPTVPYNYAEFEAMGTLNNFKEEFYSQVRLRRQPGTPQDVAITVTYLLLITTKDGDTETKEVETGTTTIAANQELSSIIDLTAEPGQSKTLLPIDLTAHKRGTIDAPGAAIARPGGSEVYEVVTLENADYDETNWQPTSMSDGAQEDKQDGKTDTVSKDKDDDFVKLRFSCPLTNVAGSSEIVFDQAGTGERMQDADIRFYNSAGERVQRSALKIDDLKSPSGPLAPAFAGGLDLFVEIGDLGEITGQSTQADDITRKYANLIWKITIGGTTIEQKVRVYRGGFWRTDRTDNTGTIAFYDGKGRKPDGTIDFGQIVKGPYQIKTGQAGQPDETVPNEGPTPMGWYGLWARNRGNNNNDMRTTWTPGGSRPQTNHDYGPGNSRPALGYVQQGSYCQWATPGNYNIPNKGLYGYDNGNDSDPYDGMPASIHFKFELVEIGNFTTRDLLQIHPDGFCDGTLGCIGIQTYDDCCKVLFLVRHYFQSRLLVD
jgi:hypothetical protein